MIKLRMSEEMTVLVELLVTSLLCALAIGGRSDMAIAATRGHRAMVFWRGAAIVRSSLEKEGWLTKDEMDDSRRQEKESS